MSLISQKRVIIYSLLSHLPLIQRRGCKIFRSLLVCTSTVYIYFELLCLCFLSARLAGALSQIGGAHFAALYFGERFLAVVVELY